MKDYTLFNLIFTIAIALVSLIIRISKSDFAQAVKVATLFILIGFPWDYFAIKNNAWYYPKDPGLTIYEVPINDLWFAFVGSYLSCLVFNKFLSKPLKTH